MGGGRGRYLLAWILPLLAAACSGGGSGRADAGGDAAADPYGCESPATGGDPFELLLGLDSEAGFVELRDGDECPVLTGGQGLLMIIVGYRAEIPFTADSVCLDCLVQVIPVDPLGGVEQPGVVVFRANEDGTFAGTSTIILGGADDAEALDGKDANISISCRGHGVSGEIERLVTLRVAPPA
jgi:hypothetical protein